MIWLMYVVVFTSGQLEVLELGEYADAMICESAIPIKTFNLLENGFVLADQPLCVQMPEE